MLLIALYGPRNLREGRSSYVHNYTSFTVIYGPCNTPSFIIIAWKAVRMCALHVVVFIVHYSIPMCYNHRYAITNIRPGLLQCHGVATPPSLFLTISHRLVLL